MSRFYGSLDGDRAKKDATRQGQSSLSGHIRGWKCGVQITCFDDGGKDAFRIEETGGTSNPSRRKFIAVIRESEEEKCT